MNKVGWILIGAFLILLSKAGQGQAVGMHWEVHEVHYGQVGSVDLNGYITYRLAIDFTNANDFLLAVTANQGATCMTPDAFDIDISSSGDVFQHVSGEGVYSGGICLFSDFDESLLFDSFATIDRFCPDPPGTIFFADACGMTPIVNWENGADLWVDDGAWFNTPGSNGTAGADLKVYVLQLTTNGDITACLGVGVHVGGVPSNLQEIQFCEDFPNPCLANALDTTLNLVDPINCFGELATMVIGNETGNGSIQYTLFADDVAQTPITDDNSYENLSAGVDYFVAMEDSFGCKDTTAVFSFIEPPLLELESELTADVLCFGDTTGVITNLATGGTDPLAFFLNDAASSEQLINSTYDNLGCGDYEVKVVDDLGCIDSTIISVSCPEILAVTATLVNSSCFALDNGSITATLTGGTGASTVTWSSSVDLTFDTQFTGGTPLNISISDLEPATYTASVVDANGCTFEISFDIDEPDPMTTVVSPTDASCNSLSDGSIDVVASGGTPDFDYSISELGGGPVTFDGLPAGEYVVISEDSQGCQILDTVTVGQPAAVVFDSLLVQDVSCFGLCDGSIAFTSLGGGEGNIVLTSIPVLNPNGNGDGFMEACQGNYTILAQDEGNNCTYSLGSHTIIEPAQLIMTPTIQDITCFGASNGSISIECAGGTGDIALTINDSLLACGSVLDSIPPGLYEVMLIDESQCFTSQTFELTEPDELELMILETIDLACGGDENGAVVFDVDGGTPSTDGDPYTFFVNGVNQTLIDLIQLGAGDYELCAQDANLCLACDSFQILQPEPITFLFNITNTSCTGMDDGALNVFAGGGTGPITISYDPPNLDINNLSEGEYVVYAVDSVGCMAQDTALVEANILTDLGIELFTTPLTCWNTGDGSATVVVLGGTAPYQIQWGDPDLQTTSTAIGLPEGSYQVIVTDGQGCEVDSLAQIVPNEGCFFIATAITPNGDGSNDEWIIGGLEYFPTATVQVFNRWGQILFESRGTYVPWDATFNGRKVSLGDYYFLINYDDNAEPITGTVTVKY